ncbi:magnesium transporter, putative [Plasmodium ovale]|uniref:Magnesium transporter, putative n=1 Tax=Plasmodium ovale TaxID=36330 RepID=A0A1D3KXU2_PLAOA|nr:magnesium transporter, putative [Plasmodium ovale]
MDTSFIGILICFVGSFLGALGDKYVHDSYSIDDENKCKRRKMNMWIVGILLSVIIDPIFTIIALYFTSAALVSPFAGVHILWNLIITNISLKTKTKLHQYMGTFFLICGIVLIITFSEKKVDIHNMKDLISMYTQTKVITYVITTFSIITILLIICLIPLLYSIIQKNKFFKKIHFMYTNKLIMNSSTNSYENSFFQKIKSNKKSLEEHFFCKAVKYDYPSALHSDDPSGDRTDIRHSYIQRSPVRRSPVQSDHSESSRDGITSDSSLRGDVEEYTHGGRKEDPFSHEDNSSLCAHSLNTKHLYNEEKERTTEKWFVLPNDKIVIINKKKKRSLMNGYNKMDSRFHMSLNILMPSNFSKKIKKNNAVIIKRGEKERIYKKHSKLLKIESALGIKRKDSKGCEKHQLSSSTRDIYFPSLGKEVHGGEKVKKGDVQCSSDCSSECGSCVSKLFLSAPQHANLRMPPWGEDKQDHILKINEIKWGSSMHYANRNGMNINSKIINITKQNIKMGYPKFGEITGHSKTKSIIVKGEINQKENNNSDEEVSLEGVRKGGKTIVVTTDQSNSSNRGESGSSGGSGTSRSSSTLRSSSPSSSGSRKRVSQGCSRSQFQYMSVITVMQLVSPKSRGIQKNSIYYRICCCTLCGMSGGFVNIFSEQLIGVFSREKFFMFEYAFSYIIISLTLFCLCNQLVFLNVSLSQFSVTSVIPLIMSNIVFFSSLTTIIMQMEGSKFEPAKVVPFSLGVLLVIVGILYLQYNINETVLTYLRKKK